MKRRRARKDKGENPESDHKGNDLALSPSFHHRLKRCQLSGPACWDLAAALIANKNLIRMDLSGNGLGLPGIRLLCEGLRHPRCRLQMIQ